MRALKLFMLFGQLLQAFDLVDEKLFLVVKYFFLLFVRKMDPWPIYFGFWCLMTNTIKLD